MGGRLFVGAAVGVGLLMAAGCASSASTSAGGGATAVAPATGSALPSTSTSSAGVDQGSQQAQAALATYRAMWADVVTVEATMNDQNMILTDHLTSGALAYFQKAIHVNHLDGYVAKGEPTLLHPTVKQVVGSGNQAKVLIEDCVDEAPFRLYTSDGTPVSTTPDGRHLTEALVERQPDGTLKVTSFVFNPVGSC